MKLLSKIALSALGSSLLVLSACDKVDVDDRFIDVPAPEVGRNVLLFDFTGQKCTNCPTAHKIIESLEAQYDSALIVVAIHGGSFGMPDNANPKIVGLAQAQGDELVKHWDISAFPSGVINGNGPYDYQQWSAEVATAISLETPISIEAAATLNADRSGVDASYTVTSATPFTGKVTAWLTQSGISAMQIDNGKLIPDYTHNNVFRGSFGELYGTAFSVGAFESGNFSASAPLKAHWGTQQLSLVVFVTDGGSNQVMQSVKVPVL